MTKVLEVGLAAADLDPPASRLRRVGHVLIVEDSRTQALELEESLLERGYETHIAVNGQEALEHLRHHRPRMILSDIRMPVMDGLTLCRAIKRDPAIRDIAVVLLTSLASASDVLDALEAGADCHISKPHQGGDLPAKIEGILASVQRSEGDQSETTSTIERAGRVHAISASREQVLRLLLATYEAALDQNRELAATRERLREQNAMLEQTVRARTAALEAESAAARESFARFRDVFDQSPIGKTITLLDGTVEWNLAMCAMLGYERDEVRGMDFQALTHPDDVAATAREVGALVAGEKDTAHFFKRFLRKDGGVVWAEVFSRLRRDASGRPLELLSSIVDVTDRRLAEEALHDSETRYRTLTEWSPEPMLVHRDNTVRYANPAALRLLGLAELGDLTSRSLLAVLTPESQAIARTWAADLRSRGPGATMTPASMQMVSADGVARDIEVESVVVTYDGEPSVFSLVRDVTESHRQDAALRESEYFFRQSQLAAHVGSYRLDFLAGTWKSSEVLDRIFGISTSDAHPMADWTGLIHPSDRERISRSLNGEILGARRHFDDEYRIVRRSDGAVRWVHGLGALEVDDALGVVAMRGTIQDVTERVEREEDLRRSEEGHRDILQTALDGYWLVDMEGCLLEANEAYAAMTGYPLEALRSMRVADLEVEAPDVGWGEHAAHVKDAGFGRFEARHRRKDGTVFDVEVSVKFRPTGGGRLVAFLRDITERQKSDEERARLNTQLQQAQKMESVGRLAGGVAHDFNNMLGVILGNVSLALSKSPPGDPRRAELEEIHGATVRSVELTRQLLAFARKQTAAPRVLDLNDVVAGMRKMLQRLIGEDIDLRWTPVPDVWRVRIDPSQIDQIMANLCVNARDAIGGVGTVAIETVNCTLTAAACIDRAECLPGDYVVLEVRDNGCGMDREIVSHLFEPFFTTKQVGQGTGLGLATVYGIVRQNQGFIDVSSAPGRGTTFRIFLPRYHGMADRHPAEPRTDPAACGGETILVVEDEPAILRLTAKLLEAQGYTVLSASTPCEALCLAEAHVGEISLVITDVVMPEMNGRDLAKMLGAMIPRLKRLFMSGYTADVIATRGVLDDGVHFIQKPFEQEALALKVREALDSPSEAPLYR